MHFLPQRMVYLIILIGMVVHYMKPVSQPVPNTKSTHINNIFVFWTFKKCFWVIFIIATCVKYKTINNVKLTQVQPAAL